MQAQSGRNEAKLRTKRPRYLTRPEMHVCFSLDITQHSCKRCDATSLVQHTSVQQREGQREQEIEEIMTLHFLARPCHELLC